MSSRGLLCLFTRVNLFVRDSKGLRVPESSRGWHVIWKRQNINTPAGLSANGVIEIKVRMELTVEDCCNRNICTRFSLQHLVGWLSSVLDKENMFRNNILLVFPAGLRESRNFALVYIDCLICIFLCGFTTVFTLLRWWNKAKLLMRGWIWRVFIVIAKTWSSASQINTSLSLPLLFFLPPALSSLRCACGQGADAHGRGDLSHAAHARRSAPSPVGLWPALRCLLTDRLLRRTPASSAPQRLLQWDDWPSAPLLQPGETGKGLVFRSSVLYLLLKGVCINIEEPKWENDRLDKLKIKMIVIHYLYYINKIGIAGRYLTATEATVPATWVTLADPPQPQTTTWFLNSRHLTCLRKNEQINNRIFSLQHFCFCVTSPIWFAFYFLPPLLSSPLPVLFFTFFPFPPHSLTSPIMCITCHGITPTMPPHPRAPPLNRPVNLRTAPMDL